LVPKAVSLGVKRSERDVSRSPVFAAQADFPLGCSHIPIPVHWHRAKLSPGITLRFAFGILFNDAASYWDCIVPVPDE
jgi:hypothetical protein